MLTAITILSGVLMVVLATYGGILTAPNRHQRNWFIGLGILGVLLTVAQSYAQHRDDEQKTRTAQTLQESVDNLKAQTVTLMNAIRLQATIDDFRHLQDTINAGFARLGAKPAKAQPTVPSAPAVVEHIRIIQSRAASTNPKAPYGLQVLLQTDVVMQPVAFQIDFDNEVTDGSAFIVGEGAYMMKATAYSNDHRAFLFSFHYPPFTPNSSLVVSVQSKYDVHVTKVQRIQPLF